MMKNATILGSLRLAAEVRRYHTWPTIQTQTVGQHTEHALRIYWQIWGEVPSQVYAYLMAHDKSEIKVGDPPHPIKAHNPALKAIYDELEDAQLAVLVGEGTAQDILGGVTDLERVRMKAADLLEMGEFAAVEQQLGNNFAGPIMYNVISALTNLALSPEDRVLVEEFMRTEVMRFRNDN